MNSKFLSSEASGKYEPHREVGLRSDQQTYAFFDRSPFSAIRYAKVDEVLEAFCEPGICMQWSLLISSFRNPPYALWRRDRNELFQLYNMSSKTVRIKCLVLYLIRDKRSNGSIENKVNDR